MIRPPTSASLTYALFPCTALFRSPIAGLYQDFDRGRMAEKAGRAGGEAIGPGLEDHDKFAHLGRRQQAAVAQQVERRAKTADHRGGLGRLAVELVAVLPRVVWGTHLAGVDVGGR